MQRLLRYILLMAVSTRDIYATSGAFEYEDYQEEWDQEPPVPDLFPWEVEEAEQRSGLLALTPSQFVEEAILIPDPGTRKLANFSFDQRRYLRRIYDTKAQRRLLMFGRQSEKTTYLGNLSLSYACLIPYFKVLYVSPSSQQTKVFSKDRLKEPIDTSPVLRAWFPGLLTDNVFEKRCANRSTITMRYAFLTADRVRGSSADYIALDEFQDILMDNIPVIEEAASHSAFQWFSYSGTPKSLDNPMEYYWQTYSTQNEWAVPCERHGTPKVPGSWHWNILGEDNIGTAGLVCDRCGEGISAQNPSAQWVSLGNPDPKFPVFDGYHIPQIMVPWIEWSEIIKKHNGYSRAKFYNEVLGRSFDSGQRPLTRDDVIANCDPSAPLDKDYIVRVKHRLGAGRIYLGVDWGQDSTNSYTVVSLGAYLDGFFRIFFIQRFTGASSEPGEQVRIISNLVDSLNVVRIGADYGGGHFPNSELLKKYGAGRIARYQYAAPSTFLKYDPNLGRFLVHRSEVMGAVFTAIKRRTVLRFPRWEDFQTPFGSDCLSIFSEYNERTRMTEYKKSPNTTDDAFHSILLCFLASMIDFPREDVFVPSAAIDRLQAADS